MVNVNVDVMKCEVCAYVCLYVCMYTSESMSISIAVSLSDIYIYIYFYFYTLNGSGNLSTSLVSPRNQEFLSPSRQDGKAPARNGFLLALPIKSDILAASSW